MAPSNFDHAVDGLLKKLGASDRFRGQVDVQDLLSVNEKNSFDWWIGKLDAALGDNAWIVEGEIEVFSFAPFGYGHVDHVFQGEGMVERNG